VFVVRRLILATFASLGAVLLFLGVAVAAGGRSATTYTASLTAVEPAATTAGVPDVSGSARLVDGEKSNDVKLHMRNLAPNTIYLWHVHEGTCAATGAPVAGWTYRTEAGANGTLTSDDVGNANTSGTSASFDADPAKSYSVNVHVAVTTNGLPAGTIIACGDLTAN
jgi:Cu/Zn superoxide dismutase